MQPQIISQMEHRPHIPDSGFLRQIDRLGDAIVRALLEGGLDPDMLLWRYLQGGGE